MGGGGGYQAHICRFVLKINGVSVGITILDICQWMSCNMPIFGMWLQRKIRN